MSDRDQKEEDAGLKIPAKGRTMARPLVVIPKNPTTMRGKFNKIARISNSKKVPAATDGRRPS